MLDVLILFGAIALLIAMQVLRGVLAFVFPSARMPRMDTMDVPEAIADLHTVAAAELGALGFAGPAWYMLHAAHEQEAGIEYPVAAWTHADGEVCWLYPIAGLDKPNRLNVFLVTRLADGRTAVSQPFDPYCAIVATPQRPSRMIGGDTYAAQLADHRAWVATLGTAPDPAGTSPEALDAFNADLFDGSRQYLLDSGKAWVDSGGLARPTLRYGLHMARLVFGRPKPPPNTQVVPPARLAALGMLAQRVAERPAPTRMQALLFAISVALFLALGAAFWGWHFAVVLLVVIAIHESGHYLAMRVFGYRNVQMLALPLVGGVTIGHEARPDAAQRAWMSLMGPLPGVLIGWAMAAMLLWVDGLPSWWITATVTFLAVNYLNVLPVPPLDGGHVVQALLPTRGARLQAAFVAVFCVLGAVLAYRFGLTVLVVLALLQLAAVPALWRLARLIGRAHADPGVDAALPRASRLQRVLELAEVDFGPTAKPGPRIGQATQALRSLDARPMRPLQRTAVAVVYLALLAGPVAGAAWWMQASQPWQAPSPEAVARSEAESRAHAAQAAALDLATLLRTIVQTNDATAALPAPASDGDIEAAQQRLGVTLPDDIAAFYRVADGVPALDILPLVEVTRLDARPDVSLEGLLLDGALDAWPVADGTHEPVRIAPATPSRWLVLTKKDAMAPLAVDAEAVPAIPGFRLFSLGEGEFLVYPGLRRWLEMTHEGQLNMIAYKARTDAAVAAAMQPLANLAMPALLDRLPRPSLVERLQRRRSPWTRAASAAPADIDAAERRLGTTLPGDARELYARHDGIAGLRLLPVVKLRSLDVTNGVVRGYLTAIVETPPTSYAPRDTGFPASPDEFDGCFVVGGAPDSAITSANLAWCPQRDPAHHYVELQRRVTFASLTDYVRDTLARVEAGNALR